MKCSDFRDDMLDVLYGEAGPAVSQRLEAHQAACPACREEMGLLASTRRSLQAWRLPEPARRRPDRPRAWAWGGLAAAAGLVAALGAGLGLTGSEFRYENGSASFRLGRGADPELRQLLASQEERHQQQIAALRASLSAESSRADDGGTLARVRDMIRESEARQALLLTGSLQDLSEENARQRRYDLARISAGLSYLDERNGKHVAQTTELMGYVLQAAQKK